MELTYVPLAELAPGDFVIGETRGRHGFQRECWPVVGPLAWRNGLYSLQVQEGGWGVVDWPPEGLPPDLLAVRLGPEGAGTPPEWVTAWLPDRDDWPLP